MSGLRRERAWEGVVGVLLLLLEGGMFFAVRWEGEKVEVERRWRRGRA